MADVPLLRIPCLRQAGAYERDSEGGTINAKTAGFRGEALNKRKVFTRVVATATSLFLFFCARGASPPASLAQ
jgi:hypothetical protein